MRWAISIPQVVADGAFDPSEMQATFVGPLHNPVNLAKAIASLDQLSRGRVEVGLVTGGPRRMFSAFDVDPAGYLAHFGEGLRLMQDLWTRSRVDFDGRFWQLRDATMEPKPFQKPHPPLWFGGSHPNSLRRAVRLAAGFIGAGSSTTAQFAEHAALVREQLQQQQSCGLPATATAVRSSQACRDVHGARRRPTLYRQRRYERGAPHPLPGPSRNRGGDLELACHHVEAGIQLGALLRG